MTGFDRDIVATVAYYDTMDFPLTVFEIWKHLMATDISASGNVGLGDIVAALDTEELRRRVRETEGFYTFAGRELLVAKRRPRERRSLVALKRIQRLVGWLRFIPFVRMVASTGSVAMRNARQGSDWDLFISVRPGHIWMGRLLVTGFLQAIGKRRHGKYTRDRACLNFWVTSESLEITLKDWFSSHEYVMLVPMFGAGEYRRFRASNVWISRFRTHFQPTGLVPFWCLPDTGFARFIRDIGEVFLGDPWIERRLGVWQQEKILANPKTAWQGSLVSANDRVLMFLPKPRGPKIFAKFKQRLSELEARV